LVTSASEYEILPGAIVTTRKPCLCISSEVGARVASSGWMAVAANEPLDAG
jgi:hypothetical protein